MRLVLVCFLLLSPLPSLARVLCGIDVLEKNNFKDLAGAQVGLITNHTGLNKHGESTVDLLMDAKNVDLKCLLSPEHGYRGTAKHGEAIKDEKNSDIGIPIYSLYGTTTRPTPEMLAGIDTLVFDIQSIGTRFYTYITTMAKALEAAAEQKIRFVVLDRPNPIRGDIREGDILDEDIRRMTGYFSMPVRHGLTVGEIAHWMNEDRNLNADLLVIKMENWKRSYWFNMASLKFVPPSPNIPRLVAALLYPGIGCFEATNVSVGRGTRRPFEIFGAPWMDATALCAHLREKNFSGVLFEKVQFRPKKDLYKGEICQGIRITVTNRNQVRPFDIFLTCFAFLMTHQPDQFKPIWDEIRVVTGSHRLRDAIFNQDPLEKLQADYDENLEVFEKNIAPFLLY